MTPCHVLVTRPAGQQQALASMLEQAGVQVSWQPSLVIEALPLSPAEQACLEHLDRYHAVVLISRNAADIAMPLLRQRWPAWPAGVHWLAVGEATARVLRDAGLSPESPAAGFNSEALLAMPMLNDLAGKRVLLLRGEGGRELLAPTLRTRAEALDEIVLYRRSCDTRFRWPAEPVDVVMVTSQQGWECIAGRVPRHCVVIAGSARIAALVAAQGFTVRAAASPHDEDMLDALARWRSENR